MSGGRLFHSRAPAIAKVRSPTVAHSDWRTSSWCVRDERRHCFCEFQLLHLNHYCFLYYGAAVLIGRITRIARPSVCPVRLSRIGS